MKTRGLRKFDKERKIRRILLYANVCKQAGNAKLIEHKQNRKLFNHA